MHIGFETSNSSKCHIWQILSPCLQAYPRSQSELESKPHLLLCSGIAIFRWMGFKLRVTTSSLLARPFCQFIEETDENEVGDGFNQQRLWLCPQCHEKFQIWALIWRRREQILRIFLPRWYLSDQVEAAITSFEETCLGVVSCCPSIRPPTDYGVLGRSFRSFSQYFSCLTPSFLFFWPADRASN